ncbi:MAG: hypothetical protein MUP80_15770 [Acidobacteriia bacterium]|nr:hypothetical protein [Terriglobia bacterium]
MSGDRTAQEAFVGVSSSKNPVPDELDPDLAAWKEVDRRLIRKGMKRIDEAKLEFEKLVEKCWGKGTVERWQREGPSEPETEEFHAWLWLDWRKTRRSKTLAEAMATDLSLSGEERQILAALNASHRTVYQVVRLDPGRGVQLENVLEGGRVFIHDRGLSLSAEKWVLIFCRAYPAGAYHFAAGGAHAFPPREKDFIKAYLSYELEKYQRTHLSAGWQESLKAKPEIFGRLTVKLHERMRRLPRLVNTDGEPMAICRAHFEVANLAEFVAGLRAHPELEELNGSEKEEGIEFVWKGQRGEETILLGRIVLRGNELLLECNSRGRLACGSELLGEIGRLDNRGEEIKEGEEILKDVVGGRGGESRGEHDELPELPPEAQAYLQEAIRRHYEEWPDHPLPALDGQTPREAAKDRLGRQRLIDLIREMEYMEQRTSSPGHVSYDWNKMRRRLGLAEE